jgi:hypothetical protein
MAMHKKLVAALLAVTSVVAFGASPASAHGRHDGHGSKGTTTVNTASVSWTITDERCSKVPDGTVINGSGMLVDKITVRTGRDGTLTNIVDSHADGTAVDQNGNEYKWRYDNSSKVTNSASEPADFRGVMVDTFRLHGDGPIRLRNGFVADFHFSPTGFEILPRSSYGDPFDFPSGGGNCDPL